MYFFALELDGNHQYLQDLFAGMDFIFRGMQKDVSFQFFFFSLVVVLPDIAAFLFGVHVK